MRFPLTLTASMAGYIAKKKLTGVKRFPLVLMLEPLHACNLTCTGCGRIREYSQTIKDKLTVAECLASVDECGAPIVSICGGEPLIYPEIGKLVRAILQRRKHIYLCTNGMFIKK
ncbi:MAG: radical SAM protein, partial [Planctomycetes bacterium]|nr:radical SAM protein [Planctomycetota bacterium]